MCIVDCSSDVCSSDLRRHRPGSARNQLRSRALLKRGGNKRRMSLASHPSTSRQTIHPLHALLLAFPVALFTTALLSDITYLKSAEIQWSNFSAWMITGALIFGAPVLLWAAIDLFRRRDDAARPRALVYLILVLVMWIAGQIGRAHV